jgi:hypothetical protein
MCLERAQTQFLSQDQGLLIVGCGPVDVRGIALCRNIAKQTAGMYLVTTPPLGIVQPLGKGLGSVQVVQDPCLFIE